MGRWKGCSFIRRAAIMGAAVAAALALPAAALAHPLGNLTINHFAGIRVEPQAIRLDVVIDYAEIPTFQERLAVDTDGDGEVSDDEAEARRLVACDELRGSLELAVGDVHSTLVPAAAGLSFPPGAGGLSTMRLVCEFVAPLAAPLSGRTTISYADHAYRARIGWREIVVQGDGTTVSGPIAATGLSDRLHAYPKELLTAPPSVASVTFSAAPGGPALPPFTAPDATPLPGAAAATSSAGPSAAAAPAPASAQSPVVAAVPGGVGAEIDGLLSIDDLSPLAILATLLLAAALGAVHAVSPGHGKTVMAAYLVGSRGTARHAVGLGLTVTLSHTLGVLALAFVTVYASTQFPSERLYPILQAGSGALVVGIGLWLLSGQVRRWRERRAAARDQAAAHAYELGHAHDHEHALEHEHHGNHEHPHTSDPAPEAGFHSHGGVRHSHLVPAGSSLSWRSLFSLGLAGGLVPSISALAILLASIQAHRPAYGVVLVVAFGIGMAVVLGGLGLGLVYARSRLEHLPPSARFGRLWEALPVVTATVVVVAGLFLTSQALSTTL